MKLRYKIEMLIGHLIDKLDAWLEAGSEEICQDKTMVLYGKYKGETVRLVPVLSDDGSVSGWIPDPDIVKIVDDVKNKAMATACKQQANTTTEPPDFNPASLSW